MSLLLRQKQKRHPPLSLVGRGGSRSHRFSRQPVIDPMAASLCFLSLPRSQDAAIRHGSRTLPLPSIVISSSRHRSSTNSWAAAAKTVIGHARKYGFKTTSPSRHLHLPSCADGSQHDSLLSLSGDHHVMSLLAIPRQSTANNSLAAHLSCTCNAWPRTDPAPHYGCLRIDR